MSKAFFLDRDGTLNVDYNYVHKSAQWTWCEDVIKALAWIQKHDFKIIVLTNQSGVARGKYLETDVRRLHRWVDEELNGHNISVDAWFYAPYHPEHDPAGRYEARDRKPNTGMFERAAQQFDISFEQSFMAGDKITDLKPAVTLGIHPVMVGARNIPEKDEQWLKSHQIERYPTLYQAVKTMQKEHDFNQQMK